MFTTAGNGTEVLDNILRQRWHTNMEKKWNQNYFCMARTDVYDKRLAIQSTTLIAEFAAHCNSVHMSLKNWEIVSENSFVELYL